MVACKNCWFADFNPNNPLLHIIHTEPDYTAKIKAGGPPPNVRVIKSCGAEMFYYLPANPIEHQCPNFKLFIVGQHEQDKKDEIGRANFKTPTSRKQLPRVNNMFLIIDKMKEGVEEVFEIFVDYIGDDDLEGQALAIYNLDDMNIRGGQIVLAYEYAGRSRTKLKDLAVARDPGMVAHINANYPDVKTEEAVIRDAARYGHKKPLLAKRNGPVVK